jgi:hypothetical protein
MTQSPRFKLRQKEIGEVINKYRLKATWKNKVRSALRDQFLPDPVDFYDYQLNINRIAEQLEITVLSGNYVPRSPKRIAQEKSKGLCRLLTIPNPLDILVLQCLSDALYADIKSAQPTSKAFFEPADHSLSSSDAMFTTPQYGSYRSWLNFQKELLRFARQRNWVVVTDIANYYDFINYTHLRNVIAGTIDVRETILDFLIFILSSILWQPDYTPRFEVGLPQINADAPRILAHCFLFELDKVLAESKHIDYARFMDDIDLGVDTYREAKQALKQIDLVLQTRQVRLNSGKTKILSKQEAEKHFKIRENVFLDKFVARINSRYQNQYDLESEKRFTSYAIDYSFRRKIFETGNGEKILKRLLTIAGRLHAEVPSQHISEILRNWPGARENAMRYFMLMPHDKKCFQAVISYIAEEHYVDDVSWLDFAKTMVSARMPAEAYIYAELEKLFLFDSKTDFFEFYAKIWTLSKYGHAQHLNSALKNSFDIWATEEAAGRLVGGLSPIFYQDEMIGDLRTLLEGANNKAGLEVLYFHQSLRESQRTYKAVRAYLTALNPSLPLQISHPKFLMLLSLLQGFTISDEERTKLIKLHHRAFSDGFYSQRLTPLV